MLLAHGANLEARTVDGWTPLHSAAFWDQPAVVAHLLASGASPNAQTAGGQTPLHLAAAQNTSSACIDLLLRHPNTDRTLRNALGDTARDIALRVAPFARRFDALDTLKATLKPQATLNAQSTHSTSTESAHTNSPQTS